MLKKEYYLVFSLILLLMISPYFLMAQEKKEEGSVSIPWEEFRKLLQLDKDEVILSWEEFQKILDQTGKKYIPPFQLKDEKVVLTRDQFKKLLNQMKPPVITSIQPPADYLMTRSIYQGKVSDKSISFRAEFLIEIFPRQRNQFVKIPLFPMNIALKNIQFDTRPGLITLDNNRHTLTTDQIGQHRIVVEFSMIFNPSQGQREFTFPIPQTPITSLELEIPYTEIEVEIPTASQVTLSERSGLSFITALLSPTNSILVRWRKKLPEAEKGPPKIYADMVSHLIIEDDALRTNTDIALSILQNTIPSLTVKIPDGFSILDVRGTGIGDWREISQEGLNYLEIPFDYPRKGNFPISINAEKLLTEDSMVVDFNGFSVNDAIRDKGFLGIELKSTSEATLTTFEGLDRLDVSELPPQLINRSLKPLLFGFKYLHHPFNLVLDIEKHEELPIISTVVDSASGVTLFTEDGKLVHRMLYKIRNTSKQFLELNLPSDAQIWSVFVGGEPAKPRINQEKILIPLNRSRQGASGLAAFDVELIYFQKSQRFGWTGNRKSEFPVPDIIMSQMIWSVYLPSGYKILHFGGTVEKEKTASGLRLLLGRERKVSAPAAAAPVEIPEEGGEYRDTQKREADKLKEQFSKNLALREEGLLDQVENEARFNQRVQEIQTGKAPTAIGGLLPIRIEIPTTGQLYRFAKTIVSEEPLTLSFTFTSGSFVLLIKISIILLLVLIIYLIRKRLIKLLRSLGSLYKASYGPFLLLFLGIILWFFSKTLAVICFVIFALILILQRFFSNPGDK